MRIMRVFVVMSFLVLAFGAQALASPDGAEPSLTVLPNGLTVLIQKDDRFPLASVRLYVHTGSAFEDPKLAGVSHLLEHMVFKSNEVRPEGETAKAIEGAGGEINAATSFDYTMYYVNMPADGVKLGMNVIHDMIFKAKFDPEELAQEKKVVLAELDRGKDDPGSRLFEDLQAGLWPEAPYGRPIIGFRDTVSAVTSEDLRNYVKQRYQPQEMLLVVCGKVNADEVLHEAESLFGGLRNDRTITPPRPETAATPDGVGPRVTVEYGEWNKVYLHAAFAIPGMRAAEEPALEVLAQLLGGDETSRLYRKFKYELRLVDDVSASAMTLERGGALIIDAELDPKNLQAFWKGLAAELAGLTAASFSKTEIDRAKLNIEDSLYRAKETLSGLASKIGYFQFFGYGLDGERNYLTGLRDVDAAQLQSVLGEYVRADALRAAVLLPKAEEGRVTDKSLLAEAVSAWPGAKQAAAGDKAGAEAASGPEIVDLGQGRTLALLPDKTLPYVAVSMVYNGGDALLTPGDQGLAALAASSLTQGAGTRKANDIENFLADRAASLAAASGRDAFTVEAKFPTRFSKDVFGLLRDVLTKPTFDATEFDRARQNQLADIKAAEDQPMGLAFRRLFPFIYAGGPYSYMRLGEPKAVSAFSPAKAKAFWEKQRNMPFVLAVCGDFDRNLVLETAKSLAAAATKPASFAFPKPDWAKVGQETLTLADRNQAHLLMVFPVNGLASDDVPGLSLLNAVLSGQGGLLFRELRDKQGLGYTVTSFLWQTVDAGFLAFYIGTQPEKAEQALAGFRETAASLRKTPVDPKDVERGKNQLTGDYHRERQSLKSRSDEAAAQLAEGFPLDRRLKNIEKAGTLTAEDLRALAEKYLDPDKAYLLRIMP